jgi:hypothetical protein|tara:strand:- start:202 stop:621 length:420 start_codon:yes stop_codon:yes gene_type:complete
MKSILNFFLFLVFTDGAFVKTNIYQNKKPEIKAIMGPNPLYDNNYKLIDKILDIKIDEERNVGRIIVEKTSSYLPKVDTIGHKVLHANNEFISAVLNMHDLPHDLRKDIVLWSIKLAQYGDNMGTHMLQMYYDLVDKCL